MLSGLVLSGLVLSGQLGIRRGPAGRRILFVPEDLAGRCRSGMHDKARHSRKVRGKRGMPWYEARGACAPRGRQEGYALPVARA